MYALGVHCTIGMDWELRSRPPINCYELVGYFGLQLARLCKNLVLRWRHLYRVPRTVTMVANRPVFPGTSRISGLGSFGTQNVPYFREAEVKIFWCDATPVCIKFHPETLKLMWTARRISSKYFKCFLCTSLLRSRAAVGTEFLSTYPYPCVSPWGCPYPRQTCFVHGGDATYCDERVCMRWASFIDCFFCILNAVSGRWADTPMH